MRSGFDDTADEEDDIAADLYAAMGFVPFDFQLAAREAFYAGTSGLLQIPTGSGKTLAAVAGPLEEMARLAHDEPAAIGAGLKLLYITPLRSLSRDTERAVREACAALDLPATVECRTGDTSSSRKARQLANMPDVLITTPESLCVLLSRKGCTRLFNKLSTIVVDEWHELLSTKRGTQLELALAWLRDTVPDLRTWALSATIGNPAEAAEAASGVGSAPSIITSDITRGIEIEILEPPDGSALPWAGHIGLAMADALLERLKQTSSCLIFTNTRKQAERWYQTLLERAPEMRHRIGLHHGSIDREIRSGIEAAARSGEIAWTVATSSLDLGIDFAPVEQVVQIGSPKSIARLVQRAGRSAHQPGRTSRLIFVPTHALELIEIHAARDGLAKQKTESRPPLEGTADVLAQHMVTLACGDGFHHEKLFAQIRTTSGYRDFSKEAFDRVLDFVARGGKSLRAYDHYRKLEHVDGSWRIRTPQIARLHRMSIGTIESNGMVRVTFTNKQHVGQVEEQFISRLKRGDRFFFAGRTLEFVMMRDMNAIVRSASSTTRLTPTWPGGSLPFSEPLAAAVRHVLAELPKPASPGLLAVLEAQARESALPARDELLVERLTERKTQRVFLYPLAGRRAHDGLAALLAYRLQNRVPGSFAVTTNDYGIQIETTKEYPLLDYLAEPNIFSSDSLTEELEQAVNLTELAKRTFRTIARIAGLIFPGYPGSPKSTRQIQVSATLLFEVFQEHESEHLLLEQARRETLATSLDAQRLGETLTWMRSARLRIAHLTRPSPLAFPLLLEHHTQRTSRLPIEERARALRERYALDG